MVKENIIYCDVCFNERNNAVDATYIIICVDEHNQPVIQCPATQEIEIYLCTLDALTCMNAFVLGEHWISKFELRIRKIK